MNPNTSTNSQFYTHNSQEAQDDRYRRLDAMARLLLRAAETVWATADREGPTSPLYSLGLGIYLCHGDLQLLIPEDNRNDLTPPGGSREISDAGDGQDDALAFVAHGQFDAASADGSTTAQLLAKVVALSRTLTPPRTALFDGPRWATGLNDLLREAQHHDC